MCNVSDIWGIMLEVTGRTISVLSGTDMTWFSKGKKALKSPREVNAGGVLKGMWKESFCVFKDMEQSTFFQFSKGRKAEEEHARSRS